MTFWDWLIVADCAALGALAVGYVYLSAVCWEDLAKPRPAVRRHPGHYGTQPAEGGDS